MPPSMPAPLSVSLAAPSTVTWPPASVISVCTLSVPPLSSIVPEFVIGDGRADIAALAERDKTGILQHALIQDLRQPADAEAAEILDHRIGAEIERAADRQRAVIDQLRGRRPEVVHRHGLGDFRFRRVDGDRIGRRQAVQLVGDDDGVVARRGNGAGFPVRRIAPQPSGRRARMGRGDPDHGGAVGAGNGDDDVLRRNRILRIRHRHRIGERQRLPRRYEIREVNRKVGKAPADRAGAGPRAVGRNRSAERGFEGMERSGRQGVASREHVTGQRRRNRVGIGEIDIGKSQRTRRGGIRGQRAARHAGAARKCDRLRAGGDDGNVVGAGDRDGEREGRHLVVRREIIVNLDVIGQRYGLAGSEEVESVVRQAVGNGRRTVVVVAGSRGPRRDRSSIAAISASCWAFSVAVTSLCAAFW